MRATDHAHLAVERAACVSCGSCERCSLRRSEPGRTAIHVAVRASVDAIDSRSCGRCLPTIGRVTHRLWCLVVDVERHPRKSSGWFVRLRPRSIRAPRLVKDTGLLDPRHLRSSARDPWRGLVPVSSATVLSTSSVLPCGKASLGHDTRSLPAFAELLLSSRPTVLAIERPVSRAAVRPHRGWMRGHGWKSGNSPSP
jgi:hypothetical protein